MVYFHKKAQNTDPGTPEEASIITQKDRQSPINMDLKQILSHSQTTYQDLMLLINHNQVQNVSKCGKCDSQPVKPVRTHHCRSCKRDIMVMDHHCPWINNCVGLRNYAYFLLYVTYMFVATFLAVYPLSITELEETKL